MPDRAPPGPPAGRIQDWSNAERLAMLRAALAERERPLVGLAEVAQYLAALGVVTREHLPPTPRTIARWRARRGFPILVLGNAQAFSTSLAVLAWLLGRDFEALSPRRRDGRMRRRVKMPPRRRGGPGA
jgi:hypothetical protein